MSVVIGYDLGTFVKQSNISGQGKEMVVVLKERMDQLVGFFFETIKNPEVFFLLFFS